MSFLPGFQRMPDHVARQWSEDDQFARYRESLAAGFRYQNARRAAVVSLAALVAYAVGVGLSLLGLVAAAIGMILFTVVLVVSLLRRAKYKAASERYARQEHIRLVEPPPDDQVQVLVPNAPEAKSNGQLEAR